MKEIEKLAEEKYPQYPTEPKGERRYNRDVNCFIKRKAFIAGAKSQSMSEWVSVEDRLPDNRQQVIFYRNNISEGYFLGVYKHGIFHQDLIMYTGVTHWMPLPQKP